MCTSKSIRIWQSNFNSLETEEHTTIFQINPSMTVDQFKTDYFNGVSDIVIFNNSTQLQDTDLIAKHQNLETAPKSTCFKLLIDRFGQSETSFFLYRSYSGIKKSHICQIIDSYNMQIDGQYYSLDNVLAFTYEEENGKLFHVFNHDENWKVVKRELAELTNEYIEIKTQLGMENTQR